MNEATAPTPESSRTAHFRRPGFNNIAPYFLVQGAATIPRLPRLCLRSYRTHPRAAS